MSAASVSVDCLYHIRAVSVFEYLYLCGKCRHEKGTAADHFPVYVDSPLANEATRVFLQTDTSFLDDEARALIRSGVNPLYFDDLHTAVSKEDSMALNNDRTPKVILSSSGRLPEAKEDAWKIIWDKKPLVLKQELEVIVQNEDGSTENRVLPAGTELIPQETDKETYLDAETSDGTRCRIEVETENGYSYTIHGVDEHAYFADLPYAG